jgi:hypothetical protein
MQDGQRTVAAAPVVDMDGDEAAFVVRPVVVGWAFHETGSIYVGFTIAAVTIFIGTLLAVFAIPHTRLRKPA